MVFNDCCHEVIFWVAHNFTKQEILGWKFLENFQDSQAYYRKFQKKKFRRNSEKFSHFQEQGRSYPIKLQMDINVSKDIS